MGRSKSKTTNQAKPGAMISPELHNLQTNYLQKILVAAVAVSTLVYLLVAYNSIVKNLWILLGIYSLAYIWLLVAAFNRKLTYTFRALSLLAVIYIIGMVSMSGTNQPGMGLLYLSTIAGLSGIFFRGSTSWVIFGFSLVSFLGVGVGLYLGILPLEFLNWTSESNFLTTWGVYIGVFTMLTSVLVTSIGSITKGLHTSLLSQKKLTDDLEQERTALEQRVEERTNQLQRRAAQLLTAGEIAREISSETELGALLNNSIYLIQKQFGFYHASIFLVDAQREYAVLQASTGEAGRQMLERNHRLKVGEQGLVGYATSTGLSRVASDVGEDAVHFQNPLLPYTRSEAALPLRVGEQIIGALDVQSMVSDAFTDEDMNVLQTIADQLAVAIEKTRLLEEFKNTVKRLDESSQQATRRDWQFHLRNARRQYAYRYRNTLIEPAIGRSEIADKALHEGQPVIQVNAGETADTSLVAVPIQLRGQTLGVIDLRINSPTVPKEVLELIQATTERLAVTLDNVRLLEQLQMRFAREHLVGNITSQIRSTSEVDGILQTAARELGVALGTSEVIVQLVSPREERDEHQEVS